MSYNRKAFNPVVRTYLPNGIHNSCKLNVKLQGTQIGDPQNHNVIKNLVKLQCDRKETIPLPPKPFPYPQNDFCTPKLRCN